MVEHDQTTEMTALKNLWQNAWEFLQTPVKPNQEALLKQPWFLVLGPKKSGKTWLIKQAELALISAGHLATDPDDEEEHHKRCNWWFTTKASFLDIPGNYLFSENKNDISWRQFLTLAKPYFKRKSPAAVLLTLSLADLIEQNKEQQQSFAQTLRQNILQLQKHLPRSCPIYLIFTQTDKIAGFNEFFSDLGEEERRQLWGISFANTDSTTNIPRYFKTQYDQLLQRLQGRVIWRLHQERNLKKRGLIQHFPWQIETLKSTLAHLLYQLGDVIGLTCKTPLNGIYLVSNFQEDATVDFIPKTLEGNLVTNAPAQEVAFLNSKNKTAYFSQRLLPKIISTTALRNLPYINSQKQHRMRFAAYATAASIVIFSSSMLGYRFNSKVSELSTAETSFTNFRLLAEQLPATVTNLDQALPTLNAIAQTSTSIQDADLPWLVQDLHHQNTLASLAQKNYHVALNNYFLPGIGAQLEPLLSTTTDPQVLYGVLKIYLMLGDPNHLDSEMVKKWFKNYWAQNFKNNNDLQKKLAGHLNNLLAQPFTPLVLNEAAIAKARTVLSNTAYPQLAYSILKNQNTSSHNPFLVNTTVADFTQVFVLNNPLEISDIYTANAFQDIYFKEIPAACAAAVNGDWVLGLYPHDQFSLPARQALTQTVQQLYFSDYTKNWKNLISNLTVAGWQNWQQGLETLDLLRTKDSPFITVLTTIANNTSLSKLVGPTPNLTTPELQTIQSAISNNFQSLDTVVNNGADKKSDELFTTTENIKFLAKYFQSIVSAYDNDRAAFLAAKLRFTDQTTDDPIKLLILQANTMPAPLNGWMNAIASNSWHLILDHTAQYINKTWRAQITPFYTGKLANRFPLFEASNQDVALADFANFFGPEGLMEQFSKNYLCPFINKNQAKWQYQLIDGQAVNLSPDLLVQLERVNLIRAMFFGIGTQFGVNFSLQSVALEPGVKNLQLTINGQSMTSSRHEMTEPHFFTWPGNTDQTGVTFTFNDQNGKTGGKNTTGAWALFRMISDENLEASADNNTKNYQLTFDLNGDSARYQLIAENAINPFIPGIISEFRCPEGVE